MYGPAAPPGVNRGKTANAGLQLMISNMAIIIFSFMLMMFLLAQDLPGKKFVMYGLLLIIVLAIFGFVRGRLLYGNISFASNEAVSRGVVLHRRAVAIQGTYAGNPDVTFWLELQPDSGKPDWLQVSKQAFDAHPPSSRYPRPKPW